MVKRRIVGSYVSKKNIVSSKRIKFLLSLQKTCIFHLLIKRKKKCLQYGRTSELLFHVRSFPCVLPAQPTLTEALEIQLRENFTACPDILQFPIQIHIFSLKLGAVEIFWARGFFLCFWGPPKVITAAEKAPQRALSQSFCTCPNSPPLESFIEWNICSLCFRTSFTFTFVLVWHLHKIQRVLKQMTVGT